MDVPNESRKSHDPRRIDDRLRPFIIPVFIPNAGCPHRCVFCNQTAITGQDSELPALDKIHSRITRYLTYQNANRKMTQIAFFGGNFLGLKKTETATLLKEAAGFVKTGLVDSIRFSTRPDTIESQSLDLLNDFPVETIEVGAQSMDDHVLAASNRGHSAADTIRAVHLLKSLNY